MHPSLGVRRGARIDTSSLARLALFGCSVSLSVSFSVSFSLFLCLFGSLQYLLLNILH